MKTLRLFLAAIVLCSPSLMTAQDEDDLYFDFVPYDNSMQYINKAWDKVSLYSLSREYPPDIKECFISFTLAYPNDALQLVLAQILGYDQGGSLDKYVFDTKNGYIRGEILTELTEEVQMCLWRLNDGNTLVGVALQGYEYAIGGDEGDEAETQENAEEEDEYEDNSTVCINGIMFYLIKKGEAIWRPRTLERLCGQCFDLKEYSIELPRQGKDIVLRHEENPKKNVLLKWQDGKFVVKRL